MDGLEHLLAWIQEKRSTLEQAKADQICNVCGEPILSFKDELSKREYEISAMCQNCQDKAFDPFTEDNNDGS
jgi:hypothetical protein